MAGRAERAARALRLRLGTELGEHYRVEEEILRAAIARVLPPDGVDEDDDAV